MWVRTWLQKYEPTFCEQRVLGLFPHLATTKNEGRRRGWVSQTPNETWLPRPPLVPPFLYENALKLR